MSIFAASLIVISREPGLLLIERLDATATLLRLELADNKIDLFVVRIDSLAEPERAPAIGRLVIFR
jgi:hypothetical protein